MTDFENLLKTAPKLALAKLGLAKMQADAPPPVPTQAERDRDRQVSQSALLDVMGGAYDPPAPFTTRRPDTPAAGAYDPPPPPAFTPPPPAETEG